MTSTLAEGCDELLRTAPEHLTDALIQRLPPSARPSKVVAAALERIQADLLSLREAGDCCSLLARAEKYADAKVCFRGDSLGVTLSRFITKNRKRKHTKGPRTSAIFWLRDEATLEDMDWIDSELKDKDKARIRCEFWGFGVLGFWKGILERGFGDSQPFY